MQTDSELQNDVTMELKWQPNIDAAQIGVTAKGGVVTLTGQVEHYAEKTAAEDAAKSVYGVKAVANDILVKLANSGQRSDADIAAAALNAFKWDYQVPDDKVKVIVRNGLVTLEGSLDWQFQKDAAERCVQYLLGVIGVINVITIKSAAKSADVKKKIEDSFRRNADLDARRIDVSSADGKVTLSGIVSSWSEREEAACAAWSAPGVTSLDDQLVVVP